LTNRLKIASPLSHTWAGRVFSHISFQIQLSIKQQYHKCWDKAEGVTRSWDLLFSSGMNLSPFKSSYQTTPLKTISSKGVLFGKLVVSMANKKISVGRKGL